MTDNHSRTIAGLPPRTAVIYLALFVMALGVYVVLWSRTPGLDGDSPQYLEVAKDLSDLHLDALHDRTIGYPILLALTGAVDHATGSLLAVSLILHFVSVWLLALLLRSAGASSTWLLVFGLLLLLPPYVEPAAYVMTENLTEFTLAAGLACVVIGVTSRRPLLLGVSGVAFGYAALTRPIYQGLAVVLAGALLMVPRFLGREWLTRAAAVRSATLVVAGSVVLLGGMSWVNYEKFNYFGLVPSLGFHLSTKTMSFVERLPDKYAPVREIFVRERNAELIQRGGWHTGSQAIWSIRSELSAATGLSRIELSRYLVRMNIQLIAANPVEYLQDVSKSLALYWFPPAGPLATMRSSALRWLWGLLHVALFGFFFLQIVVLTGVGALQLSKCFAAGGGLTLRWVRANASEVVAYAMAGLIVFYTMVLTCLIDIGEPRQRRPTDLLIVFMCFLGAHVWARTVRAAGK